MIMVSESERPKGAILPARISTNIIATATEARRGKRRVGGKIYRAYSHNAANKAASPAGGTK